MVWGVVVVAFAFIGVGAAAERRGRSFFAWGMLAIVAAGLGYLAGDAASVALAGTNAIYDSTASTVALATVIAGPLCGIACALALVWWVMRSPGSAGRWSAMPMYLRRRARDDGYECSAQVESTALAVTGGSEPERVALADIESVRVDGECVMIAVRGHNDAWELRPCGPKFPDRQRRIVAATAFVQRLQHARGR